VEDMSQLTQKVFNPQTLWDKTMDESRQGSAYEGRSAGTRRAYVETYGCQMNFSDTEIVAAVLAESGFGFTRNEKEADLVLLNTCSIRANAESQIWKRLEYFKSVKKKNPALMVGVLGCMAERLKKKLLDEEALVDMVVGPDAYRSLPHLIEEVESGQRAVNVLLSREETYADLAPVRLNTNGVSAFVTIMRGCDNMCSFCVVPFTRGRERSRDPESIVREITELYQNGYREVTLLGQNVDSYCFESVSFARLLEKVACIAPDLRVRFSTSHPKDITDDVVETMSRYENVCDFIHLPVQSGNNRILALMNRGYTREWYLNKIHSIRKTIPHIGLSTDIIAGFCSETEDEHRDTLSLMREVRFDSAFMFFYSERPGTLAARKYDDDVPEEVKKRRLSEIIELQNQLSKESNQNDVGKTFKVLIEGDSKRSEHDFCGRNSQNKMIVFPKQNSGHKPGDYVQVTVTSATGATLIGRLS
jgi:tRNA-2-methylthio-N6-dimethylallyladenosine synthase